MTDWGWKRNKKGTQLTLKPASTPSMSTDWGRQRQPKRPREQPAVLVATVILYSGRFMRVLSEGAGRHEVVLPVDRAAEPAEIVVSLVRVRAVGRVRL